MNPWLLLGIVIAWGASMWWAREDGKAAATDHCLAEQVRDANVAAIAGDATASAIAQLRPRITTIKQEVEREIRTNTVYADCRHSPGQLQRINEALTGAASEPAGRGLVPPADALSR